MTLLDAITALPLVPRALLETLRGSRQLANQPPAELIAELQRSQGDPGGASTGSEIGRIGNSVRIAARIAPWRSDCLVQAIAAKALLRRRGLPSEFYIGVAKPEGEALVSHAWLKSGGRIVVGGDVTGFSTIITPGEGQS